MPFQSQAQARWMFANKPAMAKEWAGATPSIKALPTKVGYSGSVVKAARLKLKSGVRSPLTRVPKVL